MKPEPDPDPSPKKSGPTHLYIRGYIEKSKK
jgi:hypothetical protein